MAALDQLTVHEHELYAHVKLRFIADKKELPAATVNTIESELNEHLAIALYRRGYQLVEVDTFEVEVV